LGAAKKNPIDGILSANRQVDFRPGTVLGDTVLENLIECGALGDLWLAHQPKLGRQVMVKIFLPVFGSEIAITNPTSCRIQELAKLDHPALAVLFRSGVQAGRAYLVYERSPGMRLDRLLQGVFGHQAGGFGHWDGPTISSRTAMSEMIPKMLCRPGGWQAVVAEWGAELASGLDHAHQRGVFHRSIWSGNIMISEHGQARLFDYWYGNDLNPNVVSALLPFMSPEEVALKESEHCSGDQRSDLYSLGAVMYFCLTGRTPYPVVQAPAGEMMLFDRKPPSIHASSPQVSRKLERCILKSLAVDPRQRWRSAIEMEEALRDISVQLRSGLNKRFKPVGKPLHRLFKFFSRSGK